MARKEFLSLQLMALKHFTIGDFTPPKKSDLPTCRKCMIIFHIVLKIICLITVFGGAVCSKTLSEFSLNFTEFANVLLGVVKYGILLWNRNKVYRIIKMIEVDRFTYSDDDSFLETGRRATRSVLFAYMSFVLIACVGYYTASFRDQNVEVDSKWSAVSMYTPFDFYIMERYGLIEIALNLLLVYQIYCHIFIDLFSASIFIFIARQFKTVAYLFETIRFNECNQISDLRGDTNSRNRGLDREGRPAMPHDLRNAVVYHGLLLECSHDIQHVWRYIFFFQILEICLPLCLCMYLIVHTVNFTYDEIWDTFSHLNFLVYLLYQLFLMTTCADETRQEALLVSEGAYFSNWSEGSVASRKELVNVIQRANKPIAFSALGACPVDMETYINIVRAAYGAFALMRHFI